MVPLPDREIGEEGHSVESKNKNNKCNEIKEILTSSPSNYFFSFHQRI